MGRPLVLGLHIRDTTNIGDRWCHPLDYFDFSSVPGIEIVKGDVRHPPGDVRPDYVVLGGGAIARHAPDIRKQYPGAEFIGWGVGYTSPQLEAVTATSHERFGKGYRLWGARDFGSAKHYVPCVSCMHSFFDNPPAPKHDVVVYSHAGKMPLDGEADELGIPAASNNNKANLLSALEHIASGRTVISSSFHGVYWATLMGRKVAMVPFGRKFFGLKYRPVAVKSVLEGVKAAKAFDGALDDSRQLNQTFYSKVLNLLGSSPPLQTEERLEK